ncbi:recombinase family protein [Streptomyces sp. NPDC050516]|uniref:recombinase family protein n=1 Tax=Streptomyces sp. NPDC050516 TaxID=3365621 RepID=UPI0037ACE5D1
MRVAVYARQSKARPGSSEASPEAQLAAGAALAASRGWEVVHTFKDVGRSGWDPNAVRPAFEDLMSDALTPRGQGSGGLDPTGGYRSMTRDRRFTQARQNRARCQGATVVGGLR